jgi:outer membrane murein-binding lipoprotein Lpp
MNLIKPVLWSVAMLMGVLLLSGCRDEAQVRALGDQIRALEAAQQQAKSELSRVQLQLRVLQAEQEKVQAERERLKTRAAEAEKALKAMQNEFEAYKKQYKVSIRKRAPGMELDVVEIDGKRFEKVKVRDLTAENLTFMHQAGTMSVSLKQLKPELQERLGYEVATPEIVPVAGPAKGDVGAEMRGKTVMTPDVVGMGPGAGGISKNGVAVNGVGVAQAGGGIRKNGVAINGVGAGLGGSGISKNGVAVEGDGGGEGRGLGGVEWDQRAFEVSKKLTELSGRMGNLRRSIMDAERVARNAEANPGGDPTVHRRTAEAFGVELREAEAAYQALVKTSQELEAGRKGPVR